MTTLILGHERRYPIESIRCSPIDPKLWYYKPYLCVDRCTSLDENGADIVYDLLNSTDYRHLKNVIKYQNLDNYLKYGIKYNRKWNWVFAENNSYIKIIDCMGNINWDRNTRENYEYEIELLETIRRVLKIGGKFYSYFGIYTKINENELAFEKKKRSGYQYVD